LLEESLGEENQVALFDRLLSKWHKLSTCVDERRETASAVLQVSVLDGFTGC
jgi:hypothetical protein